MRGSDIEQLVFAWLVANTILGLIVGYSEKFGLELQGCQPEMAPWLRYGIFQYMVIFWQIIYLNIIPQRYLSYVERFLTNREMTLGLVLVFTIMQAITPWVTLTLYLRLRTGCRNRITTGQAIFYWVIFSLQVLVFLVACVVLYYTVHVFCEKIMGRSRETKRRQRFNAQVTQILKTSRNPRVPYSELLKKESYSYQYMLFRVDLQLFKAILCRILDRRCTEILREQQRSCFRCKSGFEVGEKVNYMEKCNHLAHWECFISVISHQGQCSECKQPSVLGLKKSIMAGPLKDLKPLIMVLPNVQPSCREQSKPVLVQIPDDQPAIQTVAIEHFNYTVDQKTGGEPAEALPAPVAETEI